MKMRFLFCFCLCVILLCGCTMGGGNSNTTQENGEEAPELRMNDYRGGIFRIEALRDLTLSIIDGMKANNQTIQASSPDSYWTEDGYQNFVINFIATKMLTDTRLFNEERTNFETVIATLKTSNNSFCELSDGAYKCKYPSLSVVRNEKDDYTISGIKMEYGVNAKAPANGTVVYRILYDCDKDWCKAYSTFSFTTYNLPDITLDLIEYRRIDKDHFLIQTPTERLFIEFVPVAAGEEAAFAKRTIKSFAYSRLSGGTRTTYKPYTVLPETTEEGWVIAENRKINEAHADFPSINETGDLSFAYGKNDSQFLKNSLAWEDPLAWVFEDKALSQGIVYEDGVLVVVTFNKLSERYERFIYAKGTFNEETVNKLASRIEIEGLVGFNEKGEPEGPAEPDPTPTPLPNEAEPTQVPDETDNPETTPPPEGEGESS